MMERRGFFKSLLGVLALPFAKDIIKIAPEVKKPVPVSLYWGSTANGDLACNWYWTTPTVTAIQSEVYNVTWTDLDFEQGKYISIDDAFDAWSAT